MNKTEIDNYFVQFMPILIPIVDGIKYKLNKQYITTDTVINEAYLHVYKNSDSIQTTTQLEKIAVNFIKMNIGWTNSQINKMEKVNNNLDNASTEDEDDTSLNYHKTITKNIETEDKIDESLSEKIELEKWYNEKKCILEMYRAQEKSKIIKIIYDCYFEKHITSGKDMAAHLEIDKGSAWRYIRIMKSELQKFIKNNNIK